MVTFLVIFGMMLCMIALMAVGVMFKRKPISGSCGGLGNVGMDKACDCDNPCDKRIRREQGIVREEGIALHQKDPL